MPAQSRKIVTFSGIDGAGKSTQIHVLKLRLDDMGFRTLLLTFWDDVVVFRYFREFMSLKAFKGDAGVGSPDKPIERRDKNIVSWYTTVVRLFFYLLDALSLRWTLRQVSPQIDFIIFDRYIYDELANLPLRNWALRLYLKLLLAISPAPAASYLIDADPDAAYARKPEYPLGFLRKNRAAYLGIRQFIPQMRVVGPGSIDDMRSIIFHSLSDHGLGLNTRAVDLPEPCSATGEDAQSALS